MSDWKQEVLQKNLLLVHLNINQESNMYAADCEMADLKMEELNKVPLKI